ncbi:MAG: hypothetical protein AAGH89_12145 [Verrucomicrobiota bacterium]
METTIRLTRAQILLLVMEEERKKERLRQKRRNEVRAFGKSKIHVSAKTEVSVHSNSKALAKAGFRKVRTKVFDPERGKNRWVTSIEELPTPA